MYSNQRNGSDCCETIIEVEIPGIQGPRGEQGPKGEPFKYEDFTPEQLEALVAKQPAMDPSPLDIFNSALKGQ